MGCSRNSHRYIYRYPVSSHALRKRNAAHIYLLPTNPTVPLLEAYPFKHLQIPVVSLQSPRDEHSRSSIVPGNAHNNEPTVRRMRNLGYFMWRTCLPLSNVDHILKVMRLTKRQQRRVNFKQRQVSMRR
jgi:hypothetical protein